MKVYLAGKVPIGKDQEDNFDDWRVRYSKVLKEYFDAEFIDPFLSERDNADFQSIFDTDVEHIRTSDFIIINAEKRMGPGSAQEMVIAKIFNKPVVIVLPKDTPHRKSNITMKGQLVEDWIHPFLYSTADYIIESIEEIKDIADDILKKKPKGIEIIKRKKNKFLTGS